jgi:hypothetical protein
MDGRQSGSNPIALEPACITKLPKNGIPRNFRPRAGTSHRQADHCGAVRGDRAHAKEAWSQARLGRTVPVPDWVKAAVDEWLTVACIDDGLIFRCVTPSGTVWGSGISEEVVSTHH